ncbi:kinase [uncultured Clostridium sp.]|uniref:GHMP family kinase ATP-binding protein n=1 Tax=uncultured Clostridium sp. TaxID=59620 RepID=UPI0028E51946|nr:kinase [uncultured Clostridium sp.]
MDVVVRYPASFGEILQGKISDKDILCSCPINMYTEVRIFKSKDPKLKYNYSKSCTFMESLLREWGEEKYIDILDIEIKSNIPTGKGFASSTADLCGVYHGLLKLFNKEYNPKEIEKHCINIEPTDSIIFNEMTIFDYKKGLYKKGIGEYIEFNILVFEGNKVVDTVQFNSKPLPPLSNIEDLIEVFEEGVKYKDIKKIAYCSTESIKRNNERLKYDILDSVLKIKDEIKGYGIIGAHSGDALGIIYEGEVDFKTLEKYKDQLKDYKIYEVKTLKSI